MKQLIDFGDNFIDFLGAKKVFFVIQLNKLEYSICRKTSLLTTITAIRYLRKRPDHCFRLFFQASKEANQEHVESSSDFEAELNIHRELVK